MDGRDIPGFYYDKEKKKYFRIEKTHTALDPKSKHVVQNVRQEKRKEKYQRDAWERATKRRAQTVARQYVRDPLLRARLDREIGTRRPSYYNKSVWPDACASRLVDRTHEYVPFAKASPGPVRYFARDPTTRTTYYVLGDNQIKRTRDDGSSVAVLEASDSSDSSSSDSDSDSSSLSSSSSSSLFSPSSGELLAGLTSKISSLSYMPTTGTLAATTWGSDRPPVVYLADPDRDGPGVHQLFTFKQYSSIQDSAFRPTGSSDEPGILAVVAKGSLMLFTRSPAGEWHFTTAFETDIDILTVEWLSHTVIVLGQRDGKIRLHDTRSTGSSHVLTHPAPVGKIRLADDPTRIVVAGIEDTLYLYDIRSPRWTGGMADVVNQHYNHQWFAERNTSHRPNSTKRRKLMMGSRKWSQPVISFQHHNTNELDLGLDVHPRLGILAAAQDPTNSEADIIMHNLWTGKVIKELRFRPERRSSSFGRFDTRAGCLRFESDQETGQDALWADRRWYGDIVKYRW